MASGDGYSSQPKGKARREIPMETDIIKHRKYDNYHDCLHLDGTEMDATDLRRFVPTMMKRVHRDNENGRYKGVWKTRPPDWDPQVPFCDPNNCSLKNCKKKCATCRKPEKETLIKMFNYLRGKINMMNALEVCPQDTTQYEPESFQVTYKQSNSASASGCSSGFNSGSQRGQSYSSSLCGSLSAGSVRTTAAHSYTSRAIAATSSGFGDTNATSSSDFSTCVSNRRDYGDDRHSTSECSDNGFSVDTVKEKRSTANAKLERRSNIRKQIDNEWNTLVSQCAQFADNDQMNEYAQHIFALLDRLASLTDGKAANGPYFLDVAHSFLATLQRLLERLDDGTIAGIMVLTELQQFYNKQTISKIPKARDGIRTSNQQRISTAAVSATSTTADEHHQFIPIPTGHLTTDAQPSTQQQQQKQQQQQLNHQLQQQQQQQQLKQQKQQQKQQPQLQHQQQRQQQQQQQKQQAQVPQLPHTARPSTVTVGSDPPQSTVPNSSQSTATDILAGMELSQEYLEEDTRALLQSIECDWMSDMTSGPAAGAAPLHQHTTAMSAIRVRGGMKPRQPDPKHQLPRHQSPQKLDQAQAEQANIEQLFSLHQPTKPQKTSNVQHVEHTQLTSQQLGVSQPQLLPLQHMPQQHATRVQQQDYQQHQLGVVQVMSAPTDSTSVQEQSGVQPNLHDPLLPQLNSFSFQLAGNQNNLLTALPGFQPSAQPDAQPGAQSGTLPSAQQIIFIPLNSVSNATSTVPTLFDALFMEGHQAPMDET